MDENIDAGRLNRCYLHLWLAVSLGPPTLPRTGIRELRDDAPAPPAPAQQVLQPAPDRASSFARDGSLRD
ncbi:hypothetical protein [Roseomonas sp. WA12]